MILIGIDSSIATWGDHKLFE